MEQSPLDALHRALGAKMVPFGGWEMPLEYSGTLAEHRACRADAVVFDVSHLGTVRIVDADAHTLLQRTLTNDLDKVAPGRAQYTHLCDDADGSVLDDIIVWWHPDGTTFDVMPNASNTDRVRDALGGDEITHDRAVLAVQGPQARERLATVFPEAAAVGRFRVAACEWNGTPCIVAGTGYTGEPGVEIAVPAAAAAGLWSAVTEQAGVAPAGLGARDTLRLEAGLPLHGHELGPGITSLQADLAWVVAFDKPEFRGRAALLAERERGVARKLRGIVTEGRRPPRADSAVLVDSAPVGLVTSGNFSPMLEQGIALAFLPPDLADGTAVEVEVRGGHLAGQVVPTPFLKR